MNIKTTIVLFGALVVALAVFFFTQARGLKRASELDAWVFPDFHDKKKMTTSKDIDSVEIVRRGPKAETLVFVKNDGTWQMVKPHKLRVDSFLIERVVDQATGAQREKTDLSTNLSDYGLEEPGAVVTLKQGVEREWKLNLGTGTGGAATQVVYVTSSGRKEPMAVKRSTLDALFKGVNDFRSKTLLASSALNTESVTVKVGEGDPLSLAKNKEGKWQFQQPAYGEADFEGDPAPPTGEEKKITGVRDLLEAIGQIRVETDADFVEAAASQSDLATKYGLEADKPTRLRVEVKYNPGSLLGKDEKKPAVTETLLIGKRVEDKDTKGDYHYARLGSETAVVRVSAKSVAPLVSAAGSPEVLRNRDLVQIEQNKTDAIDIKNASGLAKLRKGALDSWKLHAGSAARDADRMAVQSLLADLTKRRIVKNFPSEKREAEFGFDRPLAEVSLWVEGIKAEEKKEEGKEDKKKESSEPALKSDKPTVKLTFGKKEDGLLYVKRQVGDEKPTLLAIDAGPLADRLADNSLAYLDRKLPAMPAEDTITRITVLRDGETYELERAGKKDDSPGTSTWNVQAPAAFKGRTADPGRIANLLNGFRLLNADKYVAEKPSEAELDGKFGLKSPAYRVAFTTQQGDKTDEHAILFGKETPDKAARYAKLANSDLVFQVRPHTVESLKGQLLDTTVFRFDPAKVRTLKLTGWHLVDPSIQPLEMEKKDGQWKARFEVDSGKIDSFLAGLANLRAQNFLPGAPKPDHKLTLKEGALEIALTFEGDKEATYSLLVGPLHAGDKGHYATSNKLANTVLLLPEELFKAPQSGPSHFRK